MEGKSFALPFGLGYTRTLYYKFEAIIIFTGSPPDSITCLLAISFLSSRLLFQDHVNKLAGSDKEEGGRWEWGVGGRTHREVKREES